MERWRDYIDRFNQPLVEKAIRDDCHPRIHENPAHRESIVLIHGLTDSPYFMEAIAKRFVFMGFDVYLPLLQGHGLIIPRGMADVSLDMWKENVRFALEVAARNGKRVSVGGLSTGGALAVHEAATQADAINGGVFLFSAALDFASEWGDVREQVLRRQFVRVVDALEDMLSPLVGENPYRYSRMDWGGAAQLSRLIEELDRLAARELRVSGLRQPVFAAHSAADTTADIKGVRELLRRCARQRLYELSTERNVSHASVVLEDDIRAVAGRVLESRNPYFDEMMNDLESFVRSSLLTPALDRS